MYGVSQDFRIRRLGQSLRGFPDGRLDDVETVQDLPLLVFLASLSIMGRRFQTGLENNADQFAGVSNAIFELQLAVSPAHKLMA